MTLDIWTTSNESPSNLPDYVAVDGVGVNASSAVSGPLVHRQNTNHGPKIHSFPFFLGWRGQTKAFYPNHILQASDIDPIPGPNAYILLSHLGCPYMSRVGEIHCRCETRIHYPKQYSDVHNNINRTHEWQCINCHSNIKITDTDNRPNPPGRGEADDGNADLTLP